MGLWQLACPKFGTYYNFEATCANCHSPTFLTHLWPTFSLLGPGLKLMESYSQYFNQCATQKSCENSTAFMSSSASKTSWGYYVTSC